MEIRLGGGSSPIPNVVEFAYDDSTKCQRYNIRTSFMATVSSSNFVPQLGVTDAPLSGQDISITFTEEGVTGSIGISVSPAIGSVAMN